MIELVTYHPSAITEYRNAFWWYEDIRPGLGEKFSISVKEAIENFQHSPLSSPTLQDEARCTRVHKYPYNNFVPDVDAIRILAVFHDKRDPREWQARILKRG